MNCFTAQASYPHAPRATSTRAYLELLRVEVTAFHRNLIRSSLWPYSSPRGGRPLTVTLLYGVRTFLPPSVNRSCNDGQRLPWLTSTPIVAVALRRDAHIDALPIARCRVWQCSRPDHNIFTRPQILPRRTRRSEKRSAVRQTNAHCRKALRFSGLRL